MFYSVSDDQPKCDDLKCEEINETCVVLTNENLQFAFCARQRSEYYFTYSHTPYSLQTTLYHFAECLIINASQLFHSYDYD